MKADPRRQWLLLDLQNLDTRLGQIAHRRANLPQAKELDDREAAADAARTELVNTRTAWQDVQREIEKAEADVDLVRQRAARDRALLEQGAGSPKDLQAIQHELASLDRRQAELEEVELEVMERAETLEAAIGTLEEQESQTQQEVAAARSARDEAVRALDQEVEEIGRRRGQLVEGVGSDLLGLYDTIRSGVGSGVGAAALRQRRCEGCRLELVGADIQRIVAAAEDDVLRCEECRRIIVRTPESGL